MMQAGSVARWFTVPALLVSRTISSSVYLRCRSLGSGALSTVTVCQLAQRGNPILEVNSMRRVDLGLIIAFGVAVVGGTAYVVGMRSDVDQLSNRVTGVEKVTVSRTDLQFGITELFSTGGAGENNTPMIPVDEGFCYLTRVAGDLNGNGEWAQIRPNNDDRWNLQTNSRRGSGQGGWVYAEARCLRYPVALHPGGQ